MTIRVVLVDDQAMVRTGLRMVLAAEPDIEVVGEAADGAAGVRVVTEQQPDVVLLDVRMPGVDGLEAARRILAAGLPTRVVVLTTFDEDEYVTAALRAGVSGFLLKVAPPEDLVAAVRTVADEIAADPRYADEERLGPDDAARERFRAFAKKQLES